MWGEQMDWSQAVKNLELALIELEYATADFAHWKASATKSVEAKELGWLLRQLVAAKRASELAIGVLEGQDQTDATNRAA